MKRDIVVVRIFNDWIDLAMSNGLNYIIIFNETEQQEDKVINELEYDRNVLEEEKVKWDEYIIQISEVQV